jgi:hypothetical protein
MKQIFGWLSGGGREVCVKVVVVVLVGHAVCLLKEVMENAWVVIKEREHLGDLDVDGENLNFV